MRTRLTLILVASLIFGGQAHGQPACSIAPEKKQLIERVLCGEFAAGADTAYRFTGPNCIEQSASKRLEDSALQVQIYKKCGDVEFGNQLMSATMKANQFIQVLSVCTNEQINLQAIFDGRMEYVAGRLESVSCTPSRRQLLSDRRAFFESQIQSSEQPNLFESIYEKLGISVDSAGNITDK